MRSVAITVAALAVASAGSAAADPQFTADAVQTQPGQEMRYGKLYVSDKGTRFEFQQAGQTVVQITLPADNKTITLFQLSRTYVETPSEAGASEGAFRPDVPCKASANLECKKESADKDGSAKPERWTMSPKNGVPVHIWWDAKRKMAVRQEYADGRVMQATMRMAMPFNGKTVENWEILYMSPAGMFRRALSVYAPDLGFSVLERQPDGVTRELRNVETGTPDAKLFMVPDGYKKYDALMPDDASANTMPAAAQAPQHMGGQGPNMMPGQMAPAPYGAMPPQMMPPPTPPQPNGRPIDQHGMQQNFINDTAGNAAAPQLPSSAMPQQLGYGAFSGMGFPPPPLGPYGVPVPGTPMRRDSQTPQPELRKTP